MNLIAFHPGWGDMHDGGGWIWVWAPIMMVFWLVVAGIVVWFIVRALQPATGRRPAEDGEQSRARARAILAERYARGEIDTDEYQTRLEALR